jgi:hypothetical protein
VIVATLPHADFNDKATVCKLDNARVVGQTIRHSNPTKVLAGVLPKEVSSCFSTAKLS